jgi:hypothetical protein
VKQLAVPRIDSYRFGEIVIDGQRYGNDVVIYPDHVDGQWWRKEGHSLALEDLRLVLENPPQVLVIGQGSAGRMEVPEDTLSSLRATGIQVIVEPTGSAWSTYNRYREQRKVIAALHLTC